MSYARRQKRLLVKNKKKLNVALAVQAVKNIELMVEKGAMRFDYEKYHAYLLPELFWDGKSEQHHTNLARNLLAFIDINTGNSSGEVEHTLEIYSIESNERLAAYNQAIGRLDDSSSSNGASPL